MNISLLTTAQAAEVLSLSVRRVKQLCTDGRFPGARKLGRDWLIPAGDVASFEPQLAGNPNWRKKS